MQRWHGGTVWHMQLQRMAGPPQRPVLQPHAGSVRRVTRTCRQDRVCVSSSPYTHMQVWSLDVSPDGRRVATGSTDNEIRLFAVR